MFATRAVTTCSHGVPPKNRFLKKKMSPRQLHYVSKFHRERVDAECYTYPDKIDKFAEKAKYNMDTWCERYRTTGEVCDLEQCILWGNTYMRYGKHTGDDGDDVCIDVDDC